MSWYAYGYERRPSAAERRSAGAQAVANLARTGRVAEPVEVHGRAIATTFWGKAWCANLERYSDYASRLPRGRTYARNGSVVDLHVREGVIEALVAGSAVYKVKVQVQPLSAPRWAVVRDACVGQVGSLVELLQGELSAGVMSIVTQPGAGLFPRPAEITLSCSCPDWADMCKHVAAVLYGVGARLDHQPALLFTLRGVDASELLQGTIEAGLGRAKPRGRLLRGVDLASVFGVDIDFDALVEPAAAPNAGGAASDERRLLDALAQEPGLAVRALEERLGMERRALKRLIVALQAAGELHFEGASRTGGYFLGAS